MSSQELFGDPNTYSQGMTGRLGRILYTYLLEWHLFRWKNCLFLGPRLAFNGRRILYFISIFLNLQNWDCLGVCLEDHLI